MRETSPTSLRVRRQVVKTTCQVALPEPYPAWTGIGVVELAVPGGLVEIRATARRAAQEGLREEERAQARGLLQRVLFPSGVDASFCGKPRVVDQAACRTRPRFWCARPAPPAT
jgi:hypothetical protein